MIKHISFDLWLTLIKSNPLFKHKRADFFAKKYNPLGLSEDAVFNIIRRCDKASDRLNEFSGKKIETELMYKTILKRLGHKIDSIKSSELFEIKLAVNNLFYEHPPTLLNEQILNILKQLKHEGYSLNISSNTGFIEGIYLKQCIHLIDLFSHFDFLVFSDEINASKPSNRFFEEVFNQTKVKKQEILHIGDNRIADYEGAIFFGFQALLIDNHNYSINLIKEKINETN